MKIVHLSITNNLVPPEGYGGTERVVHWLAGAQLAAGHEVHVAAPEASATKARVIPIPLWGTEEEAYAASCQKVLDLKPDVVHDHTFGQLFRLRHPEVPGVSTHHNERFQPAPNTVYPTRADAESNNATVFVHHGLDMEEYDYCEEKDDYLLFLGAIHPRKNVDQAIEIAERAKARLIVAGPVRHAGYFAKKVRKRLKGTIEYRGEAFGAIKRHLLKRARALIYPSSWESFGLSVVEAMASGTPVIVSDIPPFREIVKPGETGFICRDRKEFVKAAETVAELNPAACRDWVKENFTHTRMAEGYETLYRKAMADETW